MQCLVMLFSVEGHSSLWMMSHYAMLGDQQAYSYLYVHEGSQCNQSQKFTGSPGLRSLGQPDEDLSALHGNPPRQASTKPIDTAKRRHIRLIHLPVAIALFTTGR